MNKYPLLQNTHWLLHNTFITQLLCGLIRVDRESFEEDQQLKAKYSPASALKKDSEYKSTEKVGNTSLDIVLQNYIILMQHYPVDINTALFDLNSIHYVGYNRAH